MWQPEIEYQPGVSDITHQPSKKPEADMDLKASSKLHSMTGLHELRCKSEEYQRYTKNLQQPATIHRTLARYLLALPNKQIFLLVPLISLLPILRHLHTISLKIIINHLLTTSSLLLFVFTLGLHFGLTRNVHYYSALTAANEYVEALEGDIQGWIRVFYKAEKFAYDKERETAQITLEPGRSVECLRRREEFGKGTRAMMAFWERKVENEGIAVSLFERAEQAGSV